MKTKNFLVTVIFLMVATLSCKKESLNSINDVSNIPSISKLDIIKNWYSTQQKKWPNTSSRDITEIPYGEPDWGKTKVYSYTGKTSYIVPFVIISDSITSLNISQFVFFEIDNNKEITKSEYVYFLLDNVGGNNFSIEDLNALAPEAIDFTDIPSGLKAWVIKYDMIGKFIMSKYLVDGTAEDSDNRFKSTVLDRQPTEICENVVTIDWYWQTWINGELVYEEYLYSTTECGDEGGGGGGGSGNGGPSGCNMTETEANTFLSDIVYDESLETHITPTSAAYTDDVTGIQYQSVRLIWPFLKVTYPSPGSPTTTRVSTYSGIRYKGVSNVWRWQSLVKTGFATVDDTPVCVYVNSWAAESSIPGISQSGENASAIVTYSQSTLVYCIIGATLPETKSGTILNEEMEAH